MVHFQSGAPRIGDTIPERQVLPPPKQKKLRKPKHEGNGYDSDGGYVSDTAKKQKKKKEAKGKGDGTATGDESDGGYLSEVLARRRRKKKEKKEREMAAGAGTDDESDGGYLSSHSKKVKKSKKSSNPPGDDSDGGYLSEASKRKRFMFRLNSKSRKRQDSSDISQEEVVPPVPSLPPMSLPVAEKFATMGLLDRIPSRAETFTTMDTRSDTPTTFSSRPETPAWSFVERLSTQSDSRPSLADSTSRGPTPVPIPPPLASPNPSIVGLTSAFNDAQSVRTPSTDVLRAFGRQALTSAPRSPLSSFSSSTSTPDAPSPVKEEPIMPSSYTVPTMGMPPPKRNPSQRRVPPQISAPNTQSLSVRTHHTLTTGSETSIPVTLTPPTPTPHTRWRVNSKADKPDNIPSPALSANTLPITPVSSTFGKYARLCEDVAFIADL